MTWIFWAPLCAASLHIFEEFVLPGGFAAWYRRYRPEIQKSITPRFLVIINALLFFPSGALYPVESYPPWLRAISRVDPLTYGVSALRDVLLRGAAVSACYAPWVFLATFTVVCATLTGVLFRREI